MSKLRLDLDSIRVETFTLTAGESPAGTVFGFITEITCGTCVPSCGGTCVQTQCGGLSCYDTYCAQTCNLNETCYGNTDIDMGCTAACTGLGVECYTADQRFYACTGGNPCTEAQACTYGACTTM